MKKSVMRNTIKDRSTSPFLMIFLLLQFLFNKFILEQVLYPSENTTQLNRSVPLINQPGVNYKRFIILCVNDHILIVVHGF